MANLGILRLISMCAMLFGLLGCGLTVTSLDGEVSSPTPLPEPAPIILQVERLVRPNSDSSTKLANLESGLVLALRDTRLFSAVISPDRKETHSDAADLVLRGGIETRWGSQGAANFFTYFPGGLIFAPSWRGTRWDFQARVELELVDNRSGDIVGSYTVESDHRLVHTSGNPMHFLFAAMVIPGTIIGSGKSWIRAKYRGRMHAAAYPELWRRVAERISEDRGPSLAAELNARREACGARYGAAPQVGDSWDEFLNCQRGYFRKKGERQTSEGTAVVYEGSASRWKIYVVDGKITQWDGEVKRP